MRVIETPPACRSLTTPKFTQRISQNRHPAPRDIANGSTPREVVEGARHNLERMKNEMAVHLETMKSTAGARPIRDQLSGHQGRHPCDAEVKKVAMVKDAVLQGVRAGKSWQQTLTELDVEDQFQGQAGHFLEKWLVHEVGLEYFQKTGNVSDVRARLGLVGAGVKALDELIVGELGEAELTRGRSPEHIAAAWAITTIPGRRLLGVKTLEEKPFAKCLNQWESWLTRKSVRDAGIESRRNGIRGHGARLPLKVRLKQIGASHVPGSVLGSISLLQKPILQGIGQGKTWLESLKHLDVETSMTPELLRGLERWVVDSVGMRLFCGTRSFQSTVNQLGLTPYGQQHFSDGVVAMIGAKYLARGTTLAQLADRWSFGERAHAALATHERDAHWLTQPLRATPAFFAHAT